MTTHPRQSAGHPCPGANGPPDAIRHGQAREEPRGAGPPRRTAPTGPAWREAGPPARPDRTGKPDRTGSKGKRETPRLSTLVRASGGPRYTVAIAVDSLGSGTLRPFLLLYGIKVLGLGVTQSGTAMSVGMALSLTSVPLMGRWIDRGARSVAVASAMLVRVVGIAALLAATGLAGSPAWWFTVASLFLGIGNQCWPPAHAALITTVAEEHLRDAALAAGRSLRNAGLGVGALIATASTTGGTGAMQVLAAMTGLGYTVASMLVWSTRLTATGHGRVAERSGAGSPPASRSRAGLDHADRPDTDRPDTDRSGADRSGADRSGAEYPCGEHLGGVHLGGVQAKARPFLHRRLSLRGRVTALDVANLPYAFCFNVLEVALPAVIVSHLHASPAWSAGIFAGNTVMVVTTQVAVVVWMSRYARRSAMAASGVVLGASYLGFWASGSLGGQGAAGAMAAVSVLYTTGEIMYTGSATALVTATAPSHQLGRALSRFQLTSGIGMAASPAVLTALLARGPAALWCSLAAATLLAAATVRRWAPDDGGAGCRDGDAQAGARLVPQPAPGRDGPD